MVGIAAPTHVMSIGARIVVETGGDRFIAWLLPEAMLMPRGMWRDCRAIVVAR